VTFGHGDCALIHDAEMDRIKTTISFFKAKWFKAASGNKYFVEQALFFFNANVL